MILSNVNLLAVLLATLAYFAIGFLWYTVLFGNAWMKLMGKTREELGSPGPGYALTIVAELISALVLAFVVSRMGVTTAVDGAITGLLIGIGIVATAYGIESVFAGRKAPLYLINVGYHVVALIVMGAILGALG